MNFKQITTVFFLIFLCACKTKDLNLTKIEGQQIPISDTLQVNQDLNSFIAPYHDHVTKELDSVLTYTPKTLSREDGEFNSSLGNLIADIVYVQANPVFQSRTGNAIDFVLSNYGSIRAPLSKGNITLRSVYELMPFENSIVVVALSGIQVKEAIDFLVKSKHPHPISGIKLVVDENKKLIDAKINNEPISDSKIYYVATIDYLYNGGDHMTFFKPNKGDYVLNYKLRNALIDYFTKADTINPVIDDRFTQQKQ